MNLQPYLKNSGKLWEIAQNKGSSFVHNPVMLNLQSLIMASLVLVVNRAAIANYSALKAQGTPDGPYRAHEAYRTTIREVLGFTGGFVVLRQIQSVIKNRMGKWMNIQPPKNGPATYSLRTALGQWFHDPTKTVLEFHKNLMPNETPMVDPKNPVAKKLIQLTRNWTPAKLAEPADEVAFLRQVYKLGPIVLASIPTVGLAGLLLEKFTRDHADHVADFIGQHLGGAKKAGAPNKPQAVTAPGAMPHMAAPAFGAANQPPSFGAFNNRMAGAAPLTSRSVQRPMPMAYPPLGFSGY